LNNICAGRDFLWHCKAPRGRSGGMILGINLLTFDIGQIDEGDFFIKFKLRHKEDDFKFFSFVDLWPSTVGAQISFLVRVG